MLRLQFQSWLQASNNTGILNTFTRLWLMESEQATPVDSIKDVVQSSVKVWQTPEEGQRTYWPKCWGNNNKNEGNSLKTLNDKNQHIFLGRCKPVSFYDIQVFQELLKTEWCFNKRLPHKLQMSHYKIKRAQEC